MRLAEALEQSTTWALRRMASAQGVLADAGATRAELISRLAERLGDATALDEQLRALADDERDVLQAARANAGELRGFLIDRDHPGSAETLIERGLLFRMFAAAGPLRGEVFVVPDEVLALLPAPPAAASVPTDEPVLPAARRASDPAFSLFALASAQLRSNGNLEHDVRPWSEEPGRWAWDARWAFLQHLAEVAGLLVRHADGMVVMGTALVRLLNDPPALAERLWRGYLRDRSWSDLRQAGLELDDELADALPLRQAIVDAVRTLPEGAWIRVDAVSDWLRRTRPSLIREQLTPRGLVRFESAGWQALEHVVLRASLLGPLYWLGIVGASADGELVARRAALPASAREACTWDGVELIAPPRADLGTLLQAERYLVLERRDRPSRYHLMQSHAAAALATGGSIPDCRQLLAKLTRAPLPAVVDERLRLWEQRFGALSLRPAVVLEAGTQPELDAALADDTIRPFLRARLGPTAVEVSAADTLALAAALRAAGHLPRIDAALRLDSADPRRAYAGLIDEQVLEFLLVSLLAFQHARPERLAELEGSLTLLERLQQQFPPERLATLRAAAQRLAGETGRTPARPRQSRSTPRRSR